MKTFLTLIAALFGLQASHLNAQEKIDLQEPNQPQLLQELKDDPDGVLRVKANEDGSFKSLVVKATVEIEDVLGALKGKQLARQEAGLQCERYLSQFLQENCVFVGGLNNTVSIQTKGESAKDAAGNIVKLRSQQGQAAKSFTESDTSFSQAAIKGLWVVSSEVSPNGEFTLIMALTQKSLNEAAAVARALSAPKLNPGPTQSEPDRLNPESKVNRDALDDLR